MEKIFHNHLWKEQYKISQQELVPLPKKPKKLKRTHEGGSATTHQRRRTAPQSGADKKPKQYKSKEQRVADYEELPVIVHFDI